MENKQKKIVICGVPGSDNLGDGVIAECLDWFFRKNISNDVEICDISYRDTVVQNGSKGGKLNFFLRFPSFVRMIFVLIFFSVKYFLKGRKYIDSKFKNAGLILIGGGQLIHDVDLNFPLKLFFIIRSAEKRKIPVRLTSVGVSGNWTKLGALIMKRVLLSKSVESISVRDELSKVNLSNIFNIPNAVLLPDPALMSVNVYPQEKTKIVHRVDKVLGLGLADVSGLNYTSDIKNDLAENSLEAIASIILKANNLGFTVKVFTNGALEDEIFVSNIVEPYLEKCGLQYERISRLTTPDKLVGFISSLGSLVAYRLHANIIAASFEIPHFAVGWDNKVKSFFSQQGRSSCVYQSLQKIEQDLNSILSESNLINALSSESVEEIYLNYFKG